MVKEKAKPEQAQHAVMFPQTIGATNVAPSWSHYWKTAGGTGPSITWQDTTSGATYSAASSVLKLR